jgi:hypothetical protein
MKYPNPSSVFEQRVNDILRKESKSSALFEHIFKLQQALSLEKMVSQECSDSQNNWKILLELYTELGSINFAKMISIIKGNTVSFPSEDDYQDSIITTLCYYYKELEFKTWEEVKSLLNIKDLNTIKYGIRVRQLKGFIDQQLLKHLK